MKINWNDEKHVNRIVDLVAASCVIVILALHFEDLL